MAIIGTFKTTENGYAGRIETLAFRADISIEKAQKSADNQPDYRVFHVTADFKSEIGAAWKKKSREGSEYVSINIDDMSLPSKVYCSLVKTGAEHGHTLYWDRPLPKKDAK